MGTHLKLYSKRGVMKYTFYLSTGATISVDVDLPEFRVDNRPAANAGAWLIDKNGAAVLMGSVIAMVPVNDQS